MIPVFKLFLRTCFENTINTILILFKNSYSFLNLVSSLFFEKRKTIYLLVLVAYTITVT